MLGAGEEPENFLLSISHKENMGNHIKQISRIVQCFSKQKCSFCHLMFFLHEHVNYYISSHFSVLSPDSKELIMPIGTLGKVAPTAEGEMFTSYVTNKHSGIPVFLTV